MSGGYQNSSLFLFRQTGSNIIYPGETRQQSPIYLGGFLVE